MTPKSEPLPLYAIVFSIRTANIDRNQICRVMINCHESSHFFGARRRIVGIES